MRRRLTGISAFILMILKVPDPQIDRSFSGLDQEGVMLGEHIRWLDPVSEIHSVAAEPGGPLLTAMIGLVYETDTGERIEHRLAEPLAGCRVVYRPIVPFRPLPLR